MTTVFTRIIAGELPGRFVHRDDEVVAFLSIAPLTTGHTLVVPVAEVDDWTTLDPALWGRVMSVAARVGAAVRTAFDVPRAGLVIAGFEVPHAHVHVFPARDMTDFDFRNVRHDVPATELADAQQKIVKALGA
ncbi:HIT family protein [Asanoa sp. NPDC050611]|uniref:HIT family protein n=1 Tax=Asanoa sp. NPDC050611 TaxID=3157098 RepID=UPI00340CDF0C